MMSYDVIVIGAGVVGSAVARELSRYQLKTAVLEKELDVACGNSSRNTGMLHAGFTYKPGSLKAECAVEGNQEFDQVAKELGVPFKRTGKLVVGFTDHDRENILKYKAIGEQNGVQGMRMIDKDEINRIDPYAGGEFAMYVPSSGILDPMQYTIGLAENACQNGVKFHFGQKVTGITRDGSRILLVVLPQRIYFGLMKYERYIMIALLAAVWFGALDTPLYYLNNIVWELLGKGTGYIDKIAYSIYYAGLGTVV